MARRSLIQLSLSVLLAIGGTLVAACSESADVGVPTVTLDSSELDDLERTSAEIINRYHEAWPDREAAFSEYAEDGVFYDISFGDYWIGPEQIVRGHAQMAAIFPDLEATVESVFLSTESAAFATEWVDLWMGVKPSETPWLAGLEVYRFDGGQIAASELWYNTDTLEGPMHNCGGCASDLESLADRYFTQWSSRNRDKIAALYSEDAVIVDSMFGIEANGIDEIERLIPVRFGAEEVTRETDKLYGTLLANNLIPPISEAQHGDITGVGVQFVWPAGAKDTEVETLVLLYFGELEDGSYNAHPENLIVREEVFHNPDTLTHLIP